MTMTYTFRFALTPVELAIVGQSGVLAEAHRRCRLHRHPAVRDEQPSMRANADPDQVSRKPSAIERGCQGLSDPIPTASQIGITNGAASLNDGFPPADSNCR